MSSFIPISKVVPWPEDLFSFLRNEDGTTALDNLGVEDFAIDGSSIEIEILCIGEVILSMPGINGMEIIIGNDDQFTRFTTEINLGPTFEVSASLDISFRFDSALLNPVEFNASSQSYELVYDEDGNETPYQIDLENINIDFDEMGEFGIGFADGAAGISLPAVLIGNSGIVIEAQNISFIFSQEAADALENIDSSWRGVSIEQATIHLPEGLSDILPESISFNDAFIGSGGFSGSVFFELLNVSDYNEATAKTLLGFGFTFVSINVDFKQNTLTRSNIKGYLKVPFFDEAVEVEVGLTNDGDFTLAVSDDDGLLTLTKDGIISINVTSLEFIKEENTYSVKLSGKITPLLAGLDWPSFELKGLTIGSDGTVKVEGGWIELPDLKALDFHGFKIEIAKLGFGSDEEDGILYKWVGFSGGIQIVNELPMRGGVEGLKVMWGIDGGGKLVFKLKIGGVYLSFTIEDVLTFDGAVYFIDEDNKKEFRGGVAMNLIPVNLNVDAQFIAGKDIINNYNYFYIFIGLDLPVGIPLGPTGIGLYGFAGLFGYNMTLDYQRLIAYEVVDNRPDLSDIGNWYNQKGALAFGAGITIGTLPDTMFTVKAKTLFVILIPGPVLLIEGHVGLLSTGESFLLRVLAVLDVAAGTFLMNISASYKFPEETGELLDIAGSAEAFFSAGDPDSWHLYLGENKPESKRIRADILSFFKAQTYLMVDHEGLLMGAWIGYGLDKKYGILRVVLEAWISGELGLSLMPLQAKGSITLYGNAELSVSMVSLGISVEANVTAEAPKPLYIEASMEVQLKTPLGKPKAKITLKWEKPGVPPYPIPLSSTLGIEHRKITKNWDVTKSSEYPLDTDRLYNEGGQPVVNAPQVPLVAPDVYLVLNFDKPMEDSGLVGNNPALPPLVEAVGNYDFKYELDSVLLEYRDVWNENIDNNPWFNYENFAEGQVEDGQTAFSLSGDWQVIPDTNTIENTKLILNASTPFEISRTLENTESWWGLLDLYNPDYPCTGTVVEEKICADFETRNLGYYYSVMVQDEYIFSSPYPMNVHSHNASWLGTERAMNNGDSYQTIECLNIKAQEETERINLKVINNALITAGIGYDSYLKFTDEFSKDRIELFINDSMIDIGKVAAFIYFPELHFENLPYLVWITCIVDVGDNLFLFALDKDDNLLAEVQYDNFTVINGARVYKVESNSLPIRKIGMIGSGIRIIEICYVKHHRVEASVILVTAPQDIVKTEVHLSKSSHGNILMYNKENTQIENIVFDIPEDLPDDQVQPVILQVDTNTFRSFLISGQYRIIRICSVTEEAHEAYLNNAGLDTHLQTSLEENWGRHTAQILHPNKYYRLTVNTTTSRRKNEGAWIPKVFTEYMYFKTGNPPGPPAEMQRNAPESERYDLTEPLKDLSAYIDYTIPFNAAADEAQQFIYRSYDIGVVYNDSYIEQMYQMAGLPIKIRLRDNNNLPVLNAAGEELELLNLWGDNPELSQTREEKHYQDMLDESGCVVMSTNVAIEYNNEIIASSRDLLLSPRIQYKAQVIAGENTSIYEFAFLTSRYANFMHHIHSFADIAWNHFELINDADYEINATVLEQILSNSEDEHIKFEQLMELFELIPRQLPERLEIALMNDKNQTYGLLIETPEPLDWERCELTTTLFANKTEAIEEFIGVFKIVGGAANEVVPPLINYNAQWVEVLLMESTDISDFSIEYRHVSSSGEEYLEFHRFASGSKYNAGTLFRIYNGTEPTVTTEEIEHIHLYANFTTQTFSPDGTYIRIKNDIGEILHSRIVYSDTAFNELDTNIVRNEDGSRLFVFTKNGTRQHSELRNGIYQFKFEYKRDIERDHPVLKRFGFSTSEEAIITFSYKGIKNHKNL